ncbi:MAG: rRNA maturation RNase YbeY [Pseudohongiellaceae bacterium]
MTATVEILNESDSQWLPDLESCESWISSALEQACYTEDIGVSVKFVNESESKELNGNYRGKHAPTNVLSFPADLPREVLTQLEQRPLGDIVICPSVLETEALEQGKTLESHWAHLVTHGTLHLLGYEHDDPKDAELMEAMEITSLESLGYANPYIT